MEKVQCVRSGSDECIFHNVSNVNNLGYTGVLRFENTSWQRLGKSRGIGVNFGVSNIDSPASGKHCRAEVYSSARELCVAYIYFTAGKGTIGELYHAAGQKFCVPEVNGSFQKFCFLEIGSTARENCVTKVEGVPYKFGVIE